MLRATQMTCSTHLLLVTDYRYGYNGHFQSSASIFFRPMDLQVVQVLSHSRFFVLNYAFCHGFTNHLCFCDPDNGSFTFLPIDGAAIRVSYYDQEWVPDRWIEGPVLCVWGGGWTDAIDSNQSFLYIHTDEWIMFELEDLTTAFDIQDVYFKLKSKVGAFNITSFQKK